MALHLQLWLGLPSSHAIASSGWKNCQFGKTTSWQRIAAGRRAAVAHRTGSPPSVSCVSRGFRRGAYEIPYVAERIRPENPLPLTNRVFERMAGSFIHFDGYVRVLQRT